VGAALQLLDAPGFAPGRAISLLSAAVCAVCVGVLAAKWRRDIGTALVAGLLFFAFGFPGEIPWFALYRVDLLGVALSLGAILAQSRGRLVLAGVLCGLALLTKQTFFAAPVAGFVWLWFTDRRAALTFGLTVALVAGLPALFLEAMTRAFLSNVVAANVNPFDVTVLQMLSNNLLSTQGVPLVLCAVYVAVAQPWRSSPDRLLLLYWLASAVSLVGIAKVGANHNYWIELAGVTAIFAARGVAQLAEWAAGHRAALAAVVAVLLVALPLGLAERLGMATASIGVNVETLREPPDYSGFDALRQRVRSEPGSVIAEPLDVVVLAGRPIELEPLIYSLLADTGTWDPQPLVQRICMGDIKLVVLGYTLEDAMQMGQGPYTVWPRAIVSALRAAMRLETSTFGRYLYVPYPSPGAGQSLCH
jgi:hypothetical protein